MQHIMHNKALVSFYQFCARWLVRMIYDITYIGFDKIPTRGPALIIANHVSYMDGIVLQSGSDRQIRFIIDQLIYQLPGVNYFMSRTNAIPILPKKEHVERALDQVSEGLENGHLVGVFPEGQLTYTGNLGRFKPGVEWIIERDPVPIYPIAIVGLWDSMFSRKYRKSKLRWFPRTFRRKIYLVCGEAIHPGDARVNKLQRVILELKDSVPS